MLVNITIIIGAYVVFRFMEAILHLETNGRHGQLYAFSQVVIALMALIGIVLVIYLVYGNIETGVSVTNELEGVNGIFR